MKKLISLLLALMMCLSLLPVAAFAEEPAETPVTEQAAPAPAKEEPALEAKAEEPVKAEEPAPEQAAEPEPEKEPEEPEEPAEETQEDPAEEPQEAPEEDDPVDPAASEEKPEQEQQPQAEPEVPAEEAEEPQAADPVEGEALPEGEEPQLDEGEELFEDGLDLALLGEEPEDGACGDAGSNVSWKYDPYSGTLTVSGSGAMADYENTSAPWYPYRDMIKTIRVEKGVTRIGNYAFYKLAAVREVTLPDTLISIGECSFSFCGVKHIDLPDALESIEVYAFGYSGLTEIVIPRKINCIERGAFWYCSELVSVTLPGSLTDIDDQAFKCCGKLKNIDFPYALNHIGSSAFSGAALTSISIPEYVTSISAHAFSGCGSLEKVAFFGKITKIEDDAFGDCKKINKVHLPNMTEEEWAKVSIGKDNGWLTAVTPTFGPEIQGKCGNNVKWYYDVPTKTLAIYKVGTGSGDTYDYAVGSREIPWYAYEKDVAHVVVEGVTGLGKGILSGLVWDGEGSVNLDLKLPETLERIGESAFEGSRFKSVVIPDKVRSIGASAFSECEVLESVTLPKNLECISGSTFYRCGALTSVELPASLGSIGDYAFGFTGLTSVTLPEGIERIGAQVFSNCYALETVEYKGTIRSIGSGAFAYCTALKNFVWPDTLESIGEAAFRSDPALTSVTLAERIRQIEWDTFVGCSGLKEVVFKGKIARIGMQAFSGCSAITDVYCTDMTELEWSLVPIGERNEPLTSATFHFKPYEDTCVTLDKSYLLLAAGETAEPIGTAIVPSGSHVVYWFAADENVKIDPEDPAKNAVISVDAEGKITAGTEGGTAYVIASLTEKPGDLSAICRVDVVKENAKEDEKVTGVTVRNDQVTTEVYQTDYAKIGLVLELKQNRELAGFDPDLLYPEDIAPEAKAGGHSVTAAAFTKAALNELFDLGIIDDRTLEIIPKDETIRRCLAGDKAIKGSYKTALIVTVKGAAEPFSTNAFTLTVKKTMPAVKAKPVKLNRVRFNAEKEEYGEEIVLKAKNAGRVTLEKDLSKKVPVPAGLELVDGENAVRLTDGNLKGRYTLYLLASAEGWAIKKQTTVSVTVADTYPVVKFAPATIALNPNVQKDTRTAEMIVSPEPFFDPSLYPVTDDCIRIYEGKTPVENAPIKVEPLEGLPRMIRVSNTTAPADGKAHTYTVKVSLAGKEYPFTVKLAAKSAPVTMTLKAAGGINTRIPGSEAVITSAVKNLNVLPGFGWQVDKYAGSKLVQENVQGLFNVREDLGAFRISLVKGKEQVPEAGITYKLKVTAAIEGAEIKPVSAKIPLTIATKTPVPSATLKVTGSIDVIRPYSTVTVVPAIKNYFGYVPEAAHIRIYAAEGQRKTDVTANFDIVPNTDDGSFAITAKRGENPSTAKKYTVLFDPKLTNGEGAPVMPAKAAAMKVVMGKAAFKADPKVLPLYDEDRHDKGVTVIFTDDYTLADVKRVEFSGARAQDLESISLGNNAYLIGYKGNALPVDKKSGKVTVRIWLQGNATDKPNATLTITA